MESIVFKQCRFKVWVSSILPCCFSSEKQEYGSWPEKHPVHLSETKLNLRWLLAKSREGKSHLRNSCVLPIAACDLRQVCCPAWRTGCSSFLKSPTSLTVYCGSNKDLKSGESRPRMGRGSSVPNPTASVPYHDGPCKWYWSIRFPTARGLSTWEKLCFTKLLVPVLVESAPTTALQISMKKGCLLISGYLPNSETFPIGSAGVKGKANKETKRQNLPTF